MSAQPDALEKAVALRFPIWPVDRGKDDVPTSTKISDLENYTALTAFYQGELMELRMSARNELAGLRAEWDDLQGWQQFRRNKTEAGVDAAKRQLRPELDAEIRALTATGRELSEQIERLEREATKASRVYTFLTGG